MLVLRALGGQVLQGIRKETSLLPQGSSGWSNNQVDLSPINTRKWPDYTHVYGNPTYVGGSETGQTDARDTLSWGRGALPRGFRRSLQGQHPGSVISGLPCYRGGQAPNLNSSR